MNRRHVALLTTIAFVTFNSAQNVRDARADTAGGALVNASAASTQSQARMRYLTAGENHTCIVLNDNAVKCFGMGAEGQLGSGATVNIGDGTALSVASSSAVSLGAGRSVRSISAGASHTCALLDNSTVKCWGYGAVGALGYGSMTNRGDAPSQMSDSLPAVSLGIGRTAVHISVGSHHSCALLDNFAVKCWGRGNYGQLGIGSTATIGDGAGEMGEALEAVAFAVGRNARAIAAGSNHTCALLDNASVVCWGRGNSGQLGQGAISNIGHSGVASVATTPAIDLGSGRTALAISAGDAHTCAILDNATIKCWGSGGNGRLGTGATNNLGDGANEMGNSLAVVDVGAGRTARAISAGIAHTCAVLDNATVKCWGNGASGRLGYGNQNDLGDGANEMGVNLAAVSLGTGRTALAISAGGTSTCAVLDNATLKCWGDGSSGQIGSNDIAALGASANEMGDSLAVVALGGGSIATTTEPTAPRSVVVVAGDTQATVSWSAPTDDGGSAVTDYVVEYSVSSSTTWSVFSDGVSRSLSATVTGLVNDTAYSFRVSARNAVNTSATALASTSVTPATTTTTTTTIQSTTTTTTTTTTITTTIPTTTTITTTTTTLATTASVAPATTTTSSSVVPQVLIARTIPTIVVQPFALNVSALSTVQLERLDRYSYNLKRGDVVTCTSYSPSNLHGTVSRLNVQRARSVCKYLSVKVVGLTVKVVSAIAPLVSVQSSAAGANSQWQTLNLLRRVVVEASPGV